MFTSYFANRSVVNPISIAAKPPFWFRGRLSFIDLSPPLPLLDLWHTGTLTWDDYTHAFHESVLADLDPIVTYGELVHEYGNDLTLCCYESPGILPFRCHRRLVANWLSEATGFQILELPRYMKSSCV